MLENIRYILLSNYIRVSLLTLWLFSSYASVLSFTPQYYYPITIILATAAIVQKKSLSPQYVKIICIGWIGLIVKT